MIIDLKQIQSIEAEITKEIFRIANANNIRVYMTCGSVLGIIRDGGFIPWDDDVDIGVPYDQYAELIGVLEKSLSPIYSVVDALKDKDYSLLFARVGLKNADLDAIHVDLFPMVGLPNERKAQEEFSKKSDRINKLFNYKRFKLPDKKRTPLDQFLKEMATHFFHISLSIIPAKAFVSIFDRHCSQYKYYSSAYIMNSCGHYGLKNIIPKNYIGDTIEVDYFSSKVRIPSETDQYLKHYYRDYMRKPPADKIPDMSTTIEIPDSVFRKLEEFSIL